MVRSWSSLSVVKAPRSDGPVLERLQLPVGRGVLDAERAPERLERRAAAHEPVVHDVLGQHRDVLAEDAVGPDAVLGRLPARVLLLLHPRPRDRPELHRRAAFAGPELELEVVAVREQVEGERALAVEGRPARERPAQELRQVVVADPPALVGLEPEVDLLGQAADGEVERAHRGVDPRLREDDLLVGRRPAAPERDGAARRPGVRGDALAGPRQGGLRPDRRAPRDDDRHASPASRMRWMKPTRVMGTSASPSIATLLPSPFR